MPRRHLAALMLLAPIAAWGETVSSRGLFYLPPQSSTFAPKIDTLFFLILGITGVITLIVQVLLVYFIWRYRKVPGTKATYVHGNPRIELIWTIVPLGILVGIAVVSQVTWAEIKTPSSQVKPALTVELLAQQYVWNFRYPGPDGKFGATDPRLTTDEDPWGRVPEDAAGTDDIVTINHLHLAVDATTRILMRSRDVIHSFFVPEFRFKQDAVPGMTAELLLHPTRAGDFEIACAEFCGLGHYRMRGFLTVEPQSKLDTWLKEQATGQ